MADFAAIFTGKRYKETSSVDFVRDRASEIWGKNEHHFTLLSLRIQKRQTEIRSFAKRLIFGGKDSKIDKALRPWSAHERAPTSLPPANAQRALRDPLHDPSIRSPHDRPIWQSKAIRAAYRTNRREYAPSSPHPPSTRLMTGPNGPWDKHLSGRNFASGPYKPG